MNVPSDSRREKKLPEQAKGNPVYEQTREDMPLFCCGTNCGRNSRITVFILSIIGIACSIWLCLSPDYFKFESLRNDTFYDVDKKQPDPFEYATIATVGLFKYEILEVFVYPWPPPRERMLFDNMLDEEVRRLQETAAPSVSPSTTPSAVPSSIPSSTPSNQPSLVPSIFPSIMPSIVPSGMPTSTAAPTKCVPPLIPGSAIDCVVGSESPTFEPTSGPTETNPNDIIRETVELFTVKEYPHGMDQFDSVFYNAQLGGMLGPIFCALAFITGMMEFCCCLFKCSWLPTALFLYLAFMFQMFTLFLFLSEDFCKYDQDCRLGAAGYGTVLAVICYFICQMLVCCTPRPPPLFNCFKQPPKRMKKKKRGEDGYDDGMYYDDDEYYDEFGQDDYDDPNRRYQDDPYADDDTYDHSRYDDDGTYGDYTQNTGGNRGMPPVPEDQSYNDDGYTQYDDQSNDGRSYARSQSYRTYDDRTYDDDNQTYDNRTFDEGGNYNAQSFRSYDDSQYDDGYTQADDGYTQGGYDDGYSDPKHDSFRSREID